ncbi:hypothetical protein DL796_06160 [Kangiella spongicola]|uniref:Glycosyltransferase n=2 Tax=Kangiella spongicola TaxID=796379 RepID=A0A318D758_9GAMM|nr:hypothetical protein DL796_06160 [Kangiella spongicola]
MMLEQGHEVVFFEKPTNNLLSTLKLRRVSEKLTLGVYPELLHHQLKLFGFLRFINAKFVKSKLKTYLRNNRFDLVINFNYDYYFLTSLIDKEKFITIINDDFIAQAKPWMKTVVKKQMQETCVRSKATLSVSYPLDNMLKLFSNNSYLFLPWCDDQYEQPQKSGNRNVVLYYGFINNRIDWSIIKGLLEQKVQLRFVGPINEKKAKQLVRKLSSYENFEYLPPRCLSEVNLQDVCCSIAPYDIKIKSVQACTISNRAFRLLAKGIPVIYPSLPYIIESPNEVISTASSVNEYIDNINFYKHSFYECQPSIREFLASHHSASRYQLLQTIVPNVTFS